MRLSRAASMMPPRQAIDTSRRARALYQGDLLDGPGARTYPSVVAPTDNGGLAPRDAYREQYLRASAQLGRLLQRNGQPAEAIPLFRAVLEVEPLLEDVVRDLYRCHAELGDLDGLLEDERRLRSALSARDAEPDAATSELFSELHHALDARRAVPA